MTSFKSDSFAGFDVSRETCERLDHYQTLLLKWNRKINLVSKNTLQDAAKRHFVDSAQVWPLAPEFQTWLDFGSGAGFPGMVLAIIAAEKRPDAEIHMCESDLRKCMFINTVSRETGVPVKVHNCRIEALPDIKADIISARALASLAELFEYARPHLKEKSLLLFPKGARVDSELTEAKRHWHMDVEKIPSVTDPDGVILKIRGLSHV